MANNPYSFKTYQSKKGQARKIIEKAEKKVQSLTALHL
jgi:hypothetical protein